MISSVQFVGQDATSMTMQVTFANTKALSTDLLEPDKLRVTFLKPGLFIDRENSQQLEID